jgi:hypothetical protein
MAAPTLSFIYNTGADTAYSGTGAAWGDWKIIDVTGVPDEKIFTGGGIQGTLPTPTTTAGSRDATVRPSSGTYVVPQIYIEDNSGGIMYHVPLASGNPNTNRYVFGVYVDGTITSDLYLEYWDDDTFTTTDLPVISGSVSYPYSMINAIRTTHAAPPGSWNGGTAIHDGKSFASAAYLKGFNNKLRLMGEDSVANEPVYFNMYVRIPYDCPLFHNTPVEAYRYLYS